MENLRPAGGARRKVKRATESLKLMNCNLSIVPNVAAHQEVIEIFQSWPNRWTDQHSRSQSMAQNLMLFSTEHNTLTYVCVLREQWKANKVQMQVSMSLLLLLTFSPRHDCFAKVVMDFYCTAVTSGLTSFMVC